MGQDSLVELLLGLLVVWPLQVFIRGIGCFVVSPAMFKLSPRYHAYQRMMYMGGYGGGYNPGFGNNYYNR